jgi:hypothetical protein
MVMDHLHDDKSSLFACSLACSAWLDSSRLHKFSSISLPNFESLSGCPLAADRIQNLHVGAGYCPYRSRPGLDGFAITSEFTGLTHLGLRHVVIPSEEVIFPPTAFPRLKSLSLSSTTFKDRNHLVHFICHFPLLESLNLSVNLLRSNDQFDPPAHAPPLTHSLSVTENHAGAGHSNLHAIITSPFAIDFKSIKLDTIYSLPVGTVNALLQKCASAVEYLEILNVGEYL